MQTVIFPHSLARRGIRTRSQDGVIVIALMLILLAGSSYMLVKKFNANAQQAKADTKTIEALKTAKQALIGYAVTYPDDPDLDGGPGYMPCPDTDNDGQPEGNCSDASGTTIGRLPHGYTRLGIPDLRDGSGERLWYAISENYRYGPNKTIPLNSDTPGTLQVDNINDIVAIVFAPGEPVGNQNNRGSATESIEDYLEDDNADLDQVFTRSGGDDFNDRLVIITRDELMAVVEKRVLGEVERRLTEYRNAEPATHGWDNGNNAFPWLSPYSDPQVSAFHAILDTYAGHIPFHWSGDTPGSTNRNPFATPVGWIWHTDVGTATGNFSGTVTADCLRNVDCDDGTFPPIDAVLTSSVDCEWTNRETADCEQSGWITMSTISCNLGCLTDGTCTRNYNVQFPEYTGMVMINGPSSDTLRTRDVSLSGALPPQDNAVQIRDRYVGPDPLNLCLSGGNYIIGSGHINFVSGSPATTGEIGTNGIKYDLDVDNDELPSWFVLNDWHEMVYVAYPDSEDYPGTSNGSECLPGTDCLNLSWIGDSGVEPVSDGVRALVMLSGREIDAQSGNRPSPDPSDYFENSDGPGGLCQADGGSSICNYDGNSEFVTGRISDEFNDRLRVLELN